VGGRWSYGYTYNCVRSHTVERYNPNTEHTATVTVCDFFTANSMRWTLLDSIRVLAGWDF